MKRGRKKKNILQKTPEQLLQEYLEKGNPITVLPTIPMQYNQKLLFANGHTRPKARTRGKQTFSSTPSKGSSDRSPEG